MRLAQKSGKFTVLFDSGVRNGSDVIKALAMGAQGVLSWSISSCTLVRCLHVFAMTSTVGRPYMYGLAIAGQAGVEQILLQTISDLHTTLGLCGYKDINDVIGKKDEILAKLDYKL